MSDSHVSKCLLSFQQLRFACFFQLFLRFGLTRPSFLLTLLLRRPSLIFPRLRILGQGRHHVPSLRADAADWLLPLPHPAAASPGGFLDPLRRLPGCHPRGRFEELTGDSFGSSLPTAPRSRPRFDLPAAPFLGHAVGAADTGRPEEGGDLRNHVPEHPARAEGVHQWCQVYEIPPYQSIRLPGVQHNYVDR